MLPQNGQHQRAQPSQANFSGFAAQGTPGFDGPPYFNLDPGQAAKQMAALNAAGHARIASNTRAASTSVSSGGTSSAPYFGGINPPSSYPPQNHDLSSPSSTAHAAFQIPNNHGVPPMSNSALNPSLLEPSMSQNPNARNSMQQRQQSFLQGLHNLMAKRNTPLPPALTGVPVPNYDPAPWAAIEPGSEIGSFKLAGKDVNLFKLWGLVFQHGGGEALNASGWGQILSSFDLPEESPSMQANGSTSVSAMLSQYYRAILYPFEESYKKNLQESQRKANLANRQGMMQNMPGGGGNTGQGIPHQAMPQQGMSNSPIGMQRMGQNPSPMNQNVAGSHNLAQPTNGIPRFPMNQPPLPRPQSGMMGASDPMLPVGHIPEVNLLDQDVQGIKRKLDSNDLDNKRARPRTDNQDGTPLSLGILDRHPSEPPIHQLQLTQPPPANMVRPRQQPSRRKIEYIPLAREVETYGGRDLKYMENEQAAIVQRRPLRELNDWGTVDVEHLTLSIRSRLATELSYALTTFTLLSTMRGQTQGSGFPIFQCGELLEEVLDLLEDVAFGGPEAPPDDSSPQDTQEIFTNRQLVNIVLEEQTQPFASLERHQGSKDPDLGPMQRPANYILAVLNIIRNLSIIPDNVEFLARHERLTDLLLRLCIVVAKDGQATPASHVLSLSDVISVRKDIMYTLTTFAGLINLTAASPNPSTTIRTARRIFELVASYLVDPVEAVSPLACVQQAGVPLGPHLKPPGMADMALEVFDRFSQPDHNRQVLAKVVPQPVLWTLFAALVHRMPIVDADFQLTGRELWLSYLEKCVMAIYSLAFLAPPDLKQKIRSDRSLGFKSVMMRLLHRFMHSSPEGRLHYIVCARRVTETLKVLDDALDPFENPVDSPAPALSFGMGFTDTVDSGLEKGTGILGAHRDFGWEMLMVREVQNDDMMFRELESLVRIECQ